MRCAACQYDNGPTAKFCEECGQPLQRNCPACRSVVALSAKFCPECGQHLGNPASPRESSALFPSPQSYTPRHLADKILTSRTALEGERKQITVLFADLKGSMELIANRDPEEARALLDPILHLMMEAVHRYEGTVIHRQSKEGDRPVAPTGT